MQNKVGGVFSFVQGTILLPVYETIVQLLKGTFEVPKRLRTNQQKNAVIKYWRSKSDFSIDSNDRLVFMGKNVLRLSDVEKTVLDEFKAAKGCGARGMKGRLLEKHSGVSEVQIMNVLRNSELHQRTFPKFQNKVIPKPVSATRVGERWQIDLVDMRNDKIEMNGVIYR
ncbi:MAG: hypothetical protein ABW168_01530 [Sedimenticola sp.]